MLRMLWQTLMRGRYGFDEFSRFLLVAGLVFELIPFLFTRLGWAFIFQIIGFTLILLALLRMFSRQITVRRMEAQRYAYFKLRLTRRWAALRKGVRNLFRRQWWRERRQYKYLRCPGCHAQLRLPRGKGKIVATCPRCGNKVPGRT